MIFPHYQIVLGDHFRAVGWGDLACRSAMLLGPASFLHLSWVRACPCSSGNNRHRQNNLTLNKYSHWIDVYNTETRSIRSFHEWMHFLKTHLVFSSCCFLVMLHILAMALIDPPPRIVSQGLLLGSIESIDRTLLQSLGFKAKPGL